MRNIFALLAGFLGGSSLPGRHEQIFAATVRLFDAPLRGPQDAPRLSQQRDAHRIAFGHRRWPFGRKCSWAQQTCCTGDLVPCGRPLPPRPKGRGFSGILMTTHMYTEFDKALLAALERGPLRAQQLVDQLLELTTPFCAGNQQPFRVVDRRLQALRVARKILYGVGGWKVR